MRIKLKASTCPNNSTVPGYHSLLSLEILSSLFIVDGILTEGPKFAFTPARINQKATIWRLQNFILCHFQFSTDTQSITIFSLYGHHLGVQCVFSLFLKYLQLIFRKTFLPLRLCPHIAIQVLELDLNPGPPDIKSSALTTGPRRLLLLLQYKKQGKTARHINRKLEPHLSCQCRYQNN